jgi:RES domain-containing protein
VPSFSLRAHPRFAEISAAIARWKPAAGRFQGDFFRAVRPEFARNADIVSGEGSRIHGGRWNPPGRVRAVYGTHAKPAHALEEALALQRYYGLSPAGALPVVVTVCHADLHSVLDLTLPAVLDAIGLARTDLSAEDWRKLNARRFESMTQAVGRAAHGEGIEGLTAPSAAGAGIRNIVVFPDLLPASRRIRAKGLP